MRNELDHRVILRAYHRICEQGDKVQKGHCFEGITTYTDYDGYTLYFEAKDVLMSFGFHNTYHLEYQSERAKREFMKRVEAIANK